MTKGLTKKEQELILKASRGINLGIVMGQIMLMMAIIILLLGVVALGKFLISYIF